MQRSDELSAWIGGMTMREGRARNAVGAVLSNRRQGCELRVCMVKRGGCKEDDAVMKASHAGLRSAAGAGVGMEMAVEHMLRLKPKGSGPADTVAMSPNRAGVAAASGFMICAWGVPDPDACHDDVARSLRLLLAHRPSASVKPTAPPRGCHPVLRPSDPSS